MRQKAQQARQDVKIIDLINEEAAGLSIPAPVSCYFARESMQDRITQVREDI
jgi:hypothetical protein